MFAYHTAGYAVARDLSAAPEQAYLCVHRFTQSTQITLSSLSVQTQTDVLSVEMRAGPTSALRQFSNLRELPGQGEPLRIRLRTAQMAARCGGTLAVVGAVAGTVASICTWPAVLGASLLGALVGACKQHASLAEAAEMDDFVIKLGNMAYDIDHDPSADLAALRCQTNSFFAQACRLGPPALLLLSEMDHLLESERVFRHRYA